MMSNSQKAPLLPLFFAHAVMVGLLLFLIPPVPPSSVPLAIGISAVSTALCLYWGSVRLRAAMNAPPAKFQVEFLVSMSFAEMVMLVGTFIGSGANGRLPYALLSWILMFVLVLPKALRYSRK